VKDLSSGPSGRRCALNFAVDLNHDAVLAKLASKID